jgi:hypothetical protein
MTRFGTWSYLGCLAAAAIASFAAIWLYVLVAPMAFLEGGYPNWVVKQGFSASCDLGELPVFGDSRAEAAIDPGKLHIDTRNLALGAVSPVETYFFVRAALHCPQPPRQVVLSFGMAGFTAVNEFLWENAARYGYLSYADLREISRAAHEFGDPSLDLVRTRLGLVGDVRNALYAIRFPPLYFNSLMQGEVFRRYDLNRSIHDRVLRALGHVTYQGHTPQVADPAAAPDFKAAPIQTYYFGKMLALLRQRHVRAIFVAVPVSQSSRDSMPNGSAERFVAYLHAFADRDPNFQIVDPAVVAWPDRLYVDGIHLDAEGAALFSRVFNACEARLVKQDGTAIDCDLSWQAARTAQGETGH